MRDNMLRWLPLILLVTLGIAWGLWQFLPSNQLKIVFCDVGQGDGIYIRMPNGADVVIDGGPNDKIVDCVGKYMPPFDRKIEVVMLTHPQKDHMEGFLTLLTRYSIGNFLTVPVANNTEGFQKLKNILSEKNISISYPFAGNEINFSNVKLDFYWPEKKWLTEELNLHPTQVDLMRFTPQPNEHLAVSTEDDLNLFSLYAVLRYGSFDLLLTGDGDIHTQEIISQYGLDTQIGDIDILKFPHHGSKTGITKNFLALIQPETAVIMVGKNSYGHPSDEVLKLLQDQNVQVWRTDKNGDVILMVSPKDWSIKPTKN